MPLLTTMTMPKEVTVGHRPPAGHVADSFLEVCYICFDMYFLLCNRLLFASMKGTVNTTNLYMGTPEKKGVHLVITEALVNHKADCNALCLQDLIDSQLTGRAKDGWTGWTVCKCCCYQSLNSML